MPYFPFSVVQHIDVPMVPVPEEVSLIPSNSEDPDSPSMDKSSTEEVSVPELWELVGNLPQKLLEQITNVQKDHLRPLNERLEADLLKKNLETLALEKRKRKEVLRNQKSISRTMRLNLNASG